MPAAAWKSWGEVYNHYLSKGMDHGDAAYRADQWQERIDRAKERAYEEAARKWMEKGSG